MRLRKVIISTSVILAVFSIAACIFVKAHPRIFPHNQLPENDGNTLSKPDLFSVSTGHPAYLTDGCTLRKTNDSTLTFDFDRPGNSLIVIKAGAPLRISEQHNLEAVLRIGWDGTLGYSLYALNIKSERKGRGYVTIAATPVHKGNPQSEDVFNKRSSCFPDTPDGFSDWRKEYREKLRNRLMNGGFPGRVPLDAEIIESHDYQSFVLQKVRYRTMSDRSNTLLISLPGHVTGKVPVLLALHGHEAGWGEADTGAFREGHADDFCLYFAQRGWAVIQPATMNHSLQHPGWTLQGEWTWDAMVALDYAATLPQIDMERIAVCGLSTGGHLAMNMSALDNRVKATVVGCVLSTWNHYACRMRIPPHCDCGICSQLGHWLEQCDWAALSAPKPVEFQHGHKDASFCPDADPALLSLNFNTSVMPGEEFYMSFREVQRAYKIKGRQDNLKLYFHDSGHKVDNEEAFSFLSAHLK